MSLKISRKPKATSSTVVTLSTLNEIAERASARAKAQRERKLARQKEKGQFSQSSISSVWKEAFSRAYKGHPCVFTEKDIIILKRHLSAVQRAGTDAVEYVRWVVESWSKIMGTRFAWMTRSKPQYPAVRFMVKFSEEFQAAFAKRAEIERLSNMTAREKLVARRMEKGMDEEAAKRDVEETGRGGRKLQQVQKSFDETKERVARMSRPRVALPTVRRRPPTGGTFQQWED